MKVDLSTKMPTMNEQTLPLKSILSSLLNAGTGKQEDHLKCFRLFFKLEDTKDNFLSLNKDEIGILEACVKNIQIIPFTSIMLEYLIWPENMAASDKELAARYCQKIGNEKGKGTEQEEKKSEALPV